MFDCTQHDIPVHAVLNGWAGGKQTWTVPSEAKFKFGYLLAMRRNIPLPKVYVQETREGNFIVRIGGDLIKTILDYGANPDLLLEKHLAAHRSIERHTLQVVRLRCTMTAVELEAALDMICGEA